MFVLCSVEKTQVRGLYNAVLIAFIGDRFSKFDAKHYADERQPRAAVGRDNAISSLYGACRHLHHSL